MLKHNPKFKNYKEVFRNLLKTVQQDTGNPIVSMIISYDSKKAIAVTKKSDDRHYILQYDLESYEITFREKIKGNYIKLKEVE